MPLSRFIRLTDIGLRTKCLKTKDWQAFEPLYPVDRYRPAHKMSENQGLASL